MVKLYKQTHSLEKRKHEASMICSKYKGKIPIIVEPADDKCPVIKKKKFLTPGDIRMDQFIYIVRKQLDIKAHQAIFVIVNNNIAPSYKTIDDIYHKDKDEDGFLYVTYSMENTFG